MLQVLASCLQRCELAGHRAFRKQEHVQAVCSAICMCNAHALATSSLIKLCLV